MTIKLTRVIVWFFFEEVIKGFCTFFVDQLLL